MWLDVAQLVLRSRCLPLAAIDAKELEGDSRPFWEILHDEHAEHRGDPN